MVIDRWFNGDYLWLMVINDDWWWLMVIHGDDLGDGADGIGFSTLESIFYCLICLMSTKNTTLHSSQLGITPIWFPH